MAFRRDFYFIFRISRPLNLLIVLISYSLGAYLSWGGQIGFASEAVFWIEGGLLLVITAAGYWINDVYDHKIDLINKPGRTFVGPYISTKKVLTAYFSAMLVVMLVSVTSLASHFVIINISAIIMLYLYARLFKRAAVVGNLIVAGLTSLVLLTGALHGVLIHPFRISVLWAMVFAFTITFAREVAKDIEDMRGDMAYRLHTLPIIVGIRIAKQLLAISLAVFWLATHLPWIVDWLLWGTVPWLYIALSAIFVQLPILGLIHNLKHVNRPAGFGILSARLKWIMLAGIICLLTLAK